MDLLNLAPLLEPLLEPLSEALLGPLSGPLWEVLSPLLSLSLQQLVAPGETRLQATKLALAARLQLESFAV